MPIQRHFLGWDRPIAEAVRDYLIPDKTPDAVDLGDTLVVVPTRQAGRRLRETLALHCTTEPKTPDTQDAPPAAPSGGMLSAQVVVPASLFRPPERADYHETGALLSRAVWTDVLLEADPAKFASLFPVADIARDAAWAQSAGQTLQQLREILADGGHTLQSVFATYADTLEEPDRWQDLAEAEHRYLTRIQALDRNDAILRKIEQASRPSLPDGITRIVVASVPDPSLLMIRALKALQATLPIDILVIAPPSHQKYFDAWGRPIPEMWQSQPIDIPDPANALALTGTPKAQADSAVHAIAENADRFGPADVAIGVPDRTVIPFLETTLTEMGLPVFDPAEQWLRDHSLYGLLDAIVALYSTRRYTALRTLLRHPDVMAYLHAESIPVADTLTALDTLQNQILPSRLDDITAHLTASSAPSPLAAALTLIAPLLEKLDTPPLATAIRSVLQTLYAKRLISSKNADDAIFAAAAKTVSDALTEFAELEDDIAQRDTSTALQLLMQHLSEQTYHAEREDSQIDLEGWLELPWNPAPFLIATGMNEGCVPDGRLSDVFLPDTLRRQLELRNDAGRLARDAYLMTVLIETRRDTGTTRFIVGKTSAVGDPLKPSRLLFRCPEPELPTRATTLFAPIEEHEPHHASTISFRLDPLAPLNGTLPPDAIRTLHVTDFRGYLACPFRFYLQKVLRMDPLDDRKRELDALDFGTLLHDALRAMGASDMWRAENPDKLADFLIAHVDAALARRFPHPLPLPIQISQDAARQRLRQAAAQQVDLTQAGWEPLHVEMRYEMHLKGLPLHGTIDRIDQHRDTHALRIIDYKTSDTPASPQDTHLGVCRDTTPEFAQVSIGKKTKRWTDLQLPLYQLLLRANGLATENIEVAYFNLPKAIMQTGLAPWNNWTPALLDAAHQCAEAVVTQIQDAVFWPPSPRVDYDPFAFLLPAAPADCFESLHREETA